MATQKVLVPYNFTSADEKTIDFVIERYGQAGDIKITLFHAYVPVPKIDISDKTVMSRLSGSIAYLRQKIYELEEALWQVSQRLLQAGFATERVEVQFRPLEKEAAADIIDQALNGGYTAVVLNRNPSRVRKFFTTSVSKKVSLALKDLHIIMVQ